MSTISDLRPGDIGFTSIRGAVGLSISLGELILGEGFRIGALDVRHVFVVTEPVGPWNPMCVEAMPNGARQIEIDERWTPQYAYVRLPEDYPGQAADAAAIARAMIGTPYSFASYVALAAWRFGRKPPAADGPGMRKLEAWIDRRRPEYLDWSQLPTGANDRILANFVSQGREAVSMHLPAEAICSVLADQAWALTGKQVMPVGTSHQCVTPGALAKALLEMDGAKWMWPR